MGVLWFSWAQFEHHDGGSVILIFLVFCVFFLFLFCVCIFVPCIMFPVSLDCPLFIAPSHFSNFYLNNALWWQPLCISIGQKNNISQRIIKWLSCIILYQSVLQFLRIIFVKIFPLGLVLTYCNSRAYDISKICIVLFR